MLSAQENTENHTSKVPKFTFSKTLEKRKKELETNPLMKRFVASWQKMKNDRYSPIHHFVSSEGNLNDPNGLSFWQGLWHLRGHLLASM